MTPRRPILMAFAALVSFARADGPADNAADRVRPVPPPGITLADADRIELQTATDRLGSEIGALREAFKEKPTLLGFMPDVVIFHRAVDSALKYGEFYDAKEIPIARKLLSLGMDRARELRAGKTPWNQSTGLVVRGYVSKIDGSIQPYGLVVPASYAPNSPFRYRLDVWCHGRGEKLTELSFLAGRLASPGEFTPREAFVLHPYGRYCNANKFAGEIDLFEALDDIKVHYPIDEDRLVMRGFSMGGAACWQFAVHYPSLWAAAAPGAGFSETPEFLRVFQNEVIRPAPYAKKLIHLYDSTDYALNLTNCPVVAYSGESDKQKQAADIMARALDVEGIDLVHVIGARAGHHYTPDAKAEINSRIDRIAAVGRDPVPSHVSLTTWTLRYNRSSWVQIDGLERHWERAVVEADLIGPKKAGPEVTTRNVSRLTLAVPPGRFPLDIRKSPRVDVDGVEILAPRAKSDRSWFAHFRKVEGRWRSVGSFNDEHALRKRHGLQGPIDDAFMDSFLIVRPTRTALNTKVGAWATAEMSHAIEHWRRQFRGEARVKDDKEVTESDILAHNLILWGDPASNTVLTRLAGKLPIVWDRERIKLGSDYFDTAHHVLLLIQPNPLNPRRYVVLNSGFTFREYDYLNNARQIPRLPDYALIDVDVPVSSRSPGGIVKAGFFGEDWAISAEE